jgi:hypothetical protein
MGLVKCSDCGREISARALFCPGCGAPREAEQASPPSERKSKTVVPVTGIIAVGLGLASMAMPYFAAVFFVPATFICGIIALRQGHRILGKISIALAFLGLITIVFVSQQIGDPQQALEGLLDKLRSLR